jgi:hypothetical protein
MQLLKYFCTLFIDVFRVTSLATTVETYTVGVEISGRAMQTGQPMRICGVFPLGGFFPKDFHNAGVEVIEMASSGAVGLEQRSIPGPGFCGFFILPRHVAATRT